MVRAGTSDCSLGGMGWTPNSFSWNSLMLRSNSTLKNHLQFTFHPLIQLILPHTCICSLSSLYPEPYCDPFQIPEPLLAYYTKAQKNALHSPGFRSHMLTSFTSMALLSLKITLQKDHVLKAFGFPMAFFIRPCLKQIFLKYWLSDCLWTFSLGPSKISKLI